MLTDDQIDAISEMRAHAIIAGLTDPASKFDAEALTAAISLAERVRDAQVVDVERSAFKYWTTVDGKLCELEETYAEPIDPPDSLAGKRVALVVVE